MNLTIEQYQASKQFLLDFAALNLITRVYKVNRGVYGYIPTTEGQIRYKANEIFKFISKDGILIKFIHEGTEYTPTWTQIKLNEWIGVKLNTRL